MLLRNSLPPHFLASLINMTYLFIMDDPAYSNQKRFDRRLGYGILALMTAIMLICAGYGIYLGKTPKLTKTVAFETIGNLKIDDPVMQKGFNVGSIGAIKWHPKKVLVAIALHRRLDFHQGYHIDNKDIGLMGDRGLSIDAGDLAAPLVTDNDTLSGTFYPGVSEAVGMVGKLYSVIDSFTAVSAHLLNGTSAHASFIRRMNDIVSAADSASRKLLEMAAAINKGLPRQLDSLDTLINGAVRFSQAASNAAPQYLSNLEKLTATLQKNLQKLDDLSAKTQAMAKALDKTTARDTTDRMAMLQKKITMMHDAILHLKQQLLQLKISL